MIVTENINSNAMILMCIADSQDVEMIDIQEVTTAIDFCLCDYQCDYINTVFASQDDSNEYKNDKSNFLIGLNANQSILEIRLIGNGFDILISDNTFGTYYAKGSINNTQEQLNYVGFVCDWRKVQSLLQNGIYYFSFKETIAGREFITESVKYRLLPFSDKFADNTVKLKFIQNGKILNGLDYTGLNWVTELRVKGNVKYVEPTLTLDNYKTSTRTVTQIQDSVVENFEIETDMIPVSLGDLITKNGLLANSCLVTDYNLFAYKKLVNLDVLLTEVSTVKTNYSLNNLCSFSIKCEERNQNRVKRNI
jgi:hypothetical protein